MTGSEPASMSSISSMSSTPSPSSSTFPSSSVGSASSARSVLKITNSWVCSASFVTSNVSSPASALDSSSVIVKSASVAPMPPSPPQLAATSPSTAAADTTIDRCRREATVLPLPPLATRARRPVRPDCSPRAPAGRRSVTRPSGNRHLVVMCHVGARHDGSVMRGIAEPRAAVASDRGAGAGGRRRAADRELRLAGALGRGIPGGRCARRGSRPRAGHDRELRARRPGPAPAATSTG